MDDQPEDHNPSLDLLRARMCRLYERVEYAQSQGVVSIVILREDFEAVLAGLEVAIEL